MYCRHCGTPLQEGSRFCPNCGKPILEETQPVPNAAAPEQGNGNPDATAEAPAENQSLSEPAAPVYPPVQEQPMAEPTAQEPPANEPPVEEPPTDDPPIRKEPTAEPPFQGQPQEEQGNFTPPNPGNIPGNAPSQDPFSGTPHPSLKRNLLIIGIVSAVVLVIITAISVFTIAVFAAKNAVNNDWDEPAMEETFGADTPDTPIDASTVRTDAGNLANGGFALEGTDGLTYYIDVDTIYSVDEDGVEEYIVSSNMGYYHYLNMVGPYLYYLIDYDMTDDEDYDEARIHRYNVETYEEDPLWSGDEDIIYLTIIDKTVYFANEDTVFTADLNLNNAKPLFEIDDDFLVINITKDGIFYNEEDDSKYTIYRRSLNGGDAEKITEGFDFCIDRDTLYIHHLDDNGADAIFTSDLNGENKTCLYTFGQDNIYLETFVIHDDMLYCTTETDVKHQSISGIYTIDLTTGERTVIEETPNCEFTPYFGICHVKDTLFYWNENNLYEIQTYDLSDSTPGSNV